MLEKGVVIGAEKIKPIVNIVFLLFFIEYFTFYQNTTDAKVIAHSN